MDVVYLGVVIVFFVGCWGLVRLCSSLSGSEGNVGGGGEEVVRK